MPAAAALPAVFLRFGRMVRVKPARRGGDVRVTAEIDRAGPLADREVTGCKVELPPLGREASAALALLRRLADGAAAAAPSQLALLSELALESDGDGGDGWDGELPLPPQPPPAEAEAEAAERDGAAVGGVVVLDPDQAAALCATAPLPT